MKVETMKRALAIQQRLHELEQARAYWDADRCGMYSFCEALAMHSRDIKPDALPAPLARFKRECLDAIASEEAALRAEFDAL